MDQIIVLTGAGGGLGGVFAKEFAKLGKRVEALDFNLATAQKVVEEIRGSGGTAVAVQCDVTDRASVERARGIVRERLGKCNVLVNCAGIHDPLAKTTSETYAAGDERNAEVTGVRARMSDEEYAKALSRPRSLFNMDPDNLRRVMDVNWTGTFIACQMFAVDMVGRDGCSIINITSMAAYDALSIVPAYASSKAAVDMFTRWLSNYLSNEYGKVRVNAIAPGFFLTPLNRDLYVNPDGGYTQRYRNVVHRTPMGRLGDVKELMGALRFFSDPEMSGYITGQVIAVDGGFLSCPGI